MRERESLSMCIVRLMGCQFSTVCVFTRGEDVCLDTLCTCVCSVAVLLLFPGVREVFHSFSPS